MNAKPSILLLDIETAPALAYVWRLFDENISTDQLIAPSRIICIGAKWFGDRRMFYRDESQGARQMLADTALLLAEADAVVTYNGDHFDLPKLHGAFALHDVAPPPPIASIDLFKTVKGMGYTSGKLAHVAPLLGLGNKVRHPGFRLWAEFEAGDRAAHALMKRYNLQDVRLLESLYLKLRPYIKTHPHLSRAGACPACGSFDVQARGVRRTRCYLIQRLHCQACGHWSKGAQSKAA